MVYFNNTLCVDYGFLTGQGIMSRATYERLLSDGVINRMQRGCRERPALVTYDSLPCRFQDKIQVVAGDVVKAARVNLVESRIVHSAEASGFFDGYRLGDGRMLPPEKRREYYANAIVLDAVKSFLVMKRDRRAALNKRMVRSWEQMAEYVQEIDRSRYPHTLPGCARRLEDKYKRYERDGLAGLIHENYMNKNALIVDDEEKESVLIELIGNGNNLNNAQICEKYNLAASKLGWKKITTGTVAVWRERKDMETYAGRRGVNEFRNSRTMQVKRSAPTYPLYYWTMDGWDVELMYQAVSEGRRTYHHRPTVVVVLDACIKYPVGYAVGTHETPGLIREALRNAERHLEELFGGMYRAQQLQSDRYSIKKMTPMYGAVTERYTPARKGNAKAKVVEPYFNGVNRKYCQMLPNWSGFGITSDRDRQPNDDMLNKRKHDFPDFAGVCDQVRLIIESERKEKRERYVSLWGQMPEEHKVRLPFEQYLMLFGSRTGFRNSLQGNGLKVTIEGEKYDYDCFDVTFRDHFAEKWEVRYDADDLSRVLAVSEDERLQYMLERKYVQPMALVERAPGDYEALERVRAYNEELEKRIVDARGKSGDIVRGLLEGRPELDTLRKLLITDSEGQHKALRAGEGERGSRGRALCAGEVAADGSGEGERGSRGRALCAGEVAADGSGESERSSRGKALCAGEVVGVGRLEEEDIYEMM